MNLKVIAALILASMANVTSAWQQNDNDSANAAKARGRELLEMVKAGRLDLMTRSELEFVIKTQNNKLNNLSKFSDYLQRNNMDTTSFARPGMMGNSFE